MFARYWVEALQDPTADVDKSDSISAMEAFEYADRKTADSMSRRSGWLRSIRCSRTRAWAKRCGADEERRGAAGELYGAAHWREPEAANDPAKRALLAKKEDLEQKIDALKYEKAAMDPADYKKQLTEALVQLAQVQAELDK